MKGIKVIKKDEEYAVLEIDFPIKQLVLDDNWMDGFTRNKILKFGKKLLKKEVMDTWDNPLAKEAKKKKFLKVKVQVFTDEDEKGGCRNF